MFWTEFKWMVVDYLREHPNSRKTEILEGVSAAAGRSRFYLGWTMWNDTRDQLSRCDPPVMRRDHANRYQISEQAVTYWLVQDQERLHRQGLAQAKRDLNAVADSTHMSREEWVERLLELRDILLWVESHTPEEWWETRTQREAHPHPLGWPGVAQAPQDITRLELLVEDVG